MRHPAGQRKRSRKAIKNYGDEAVENRNFSAVEDNPESFFIMSKLGTDAVINAAAEAKAAGLSHTFVRGDQVVRLYPDGHEEVISSASAEKIKGDAFYIYYQPPVLPSRGK